MNGGPIRRIVIDISQETWVCSMESVSRQSVLVIGTRALLIALVLIEEGLSGHPGISVDGRTIAVVGTVSHAHAEFGDHSFSIITVISEVSWPEPSTIVSSCLEIAVAVQLITLTSSKSDEVPLVSSNAAALPIGKHPVVQRVWPVNGLEIRVYVSVL